MANQYGGTHQATRRQFKPDVDAGRARCAELVCVMQSRWIRPGSAWDLAHDRTHGGYLGPAHRRCNRAEGARFGNRLRGLRRRSGRRGGPRLSWSSREW
jgi:hypothetical protein